MFYPYRLLNNRPSYDRKLQTKKTALPWGAPFFVVEYWFLLLTSVRDDGAHIRHSGVSDAHSCDGHNYDARSDGSHSDGDSGGVRNTGCKTTMNSNGGADSSCSHNRHRNTSCSNGGDDGGYTCYRG